MKREAPSGRTLRETPTVAYHGLPDPKRALRVGLLAADDPSCGCSHGGHVCLAERPEVAANFGTVMVVDVAGLPVWWEKGEGRIHGDIPPERVTVIAEQPAPDWVGWEDPCIRINHSSCLAPLAALPNPPSISGETTRRGGLEC